MKAWSEQCTSTFHVLTFGNLAFSAFTPITTVSLLSYVQSFIYVHLLLSLFDLLNNPKFYNAKPARLRLATIKCQSRKKESVTRERGPKARSEQCTSTCHVLTLGNLGFIALTPITTVTLSSYLQSCIYVHLLLSLFDLLNNPKFYNAKPARLRLATIKGQYGSKETVTRERGPKARSEQCTSTCHLLI